jgi:hypothetical protein
MINNQDYSINYINLEKRETTLIVPSWRIIFYGQSFHKFTLERVLNLSLSAAKLLEAKKQPFKVDLNRKIIAICQLLTITYVSYVVR